MSLGTIETVPKTDHPLIAEHIQNHHAELRFHTLVLSFQLQYHSQIMQRDGSARMVWILAIDVLLPACCLQTGPRGTK